MGSRVVEMGNIKVTFLGTGTSQGIPVVACSCEVCRSLDVRDTRFRTSCMLELNDKRIVIDAGPDFRQQMLKHGVQSLDAILITHAHRDHVGGLDDVRAFNYAQTKDMPIYGNQKALDWIKRDFSYAFVEHSYPGIPKFDLRRIDVKTEGMVNVEGIPVVPVEVMHHKLPALAFRVGNFTYITDAKTITEKELNKIKGTQVLVVNALRREEHFSHFTLSEALNLIEFIQPERAYLTHISHYLGKYEDVSKELPKNVFLAYDDLQITI